ncbi:MAG TPA: TIGR03084 family metal-binding protein [Steroidobacteraceae bacterium]|nr:TIGR03084 family metal-binding protein [Steroidobacteraceae bacterium]
MNEAAPRLPQALDYRDECEALYAALVAAPADAWHTPTQFKQWTFDDVLGHLCMFDEAAEVAARSREELHALLKKVMANMAAGKSFQQYTRDWLQGCSGAALLQRWRDQYLRLAAVFRDVDPDRRLPWFGPDMSARSFISARQMETWAHGQAIFDALGFERVEHDRIRNIAVMGVNTFVWTFTVHRRAIPAARPYVRLESPSGATWEWNDPASADRVEGSAVDFCRVVTQTRNVQDTGLRVSGPVAQEWMSIAQCFAGAPELPPAPGTRYRK